MNLHHDTITVHGRTDECQKLIKNKQGGVQTGASTIERIMQGGVQTGASSLERISKGGVWTVRHGGMEEQV